MSAPVEEYRDPLGSEFPRVALTDCPRCDAEGEMQPLRYDYARRRWQLTCERCSYTYPAPPYLTPVGEIVHSEGKRTSTR